MMPNSENVPYRWHKVLLYALLLLLGGAQVQQEPHERFLVLMLWLIC